jgi:TonB family protein
MSIFLVLAGGAAAAQGAQAVLADIARPVGDPAAWVTINDYPKEAVEKKQAGVVGFKLEIDAGGNVVACRIAQSSGAPSLDAATCALVFVRARFNSLESESGVTRIFSSRVKWVYPALSGSSEAGALKPVELTSMLRDLGGSSRLKVDPEGMISQCERVSRYENVLAGPDLCKVFPVGMRYGPPTRAKGKPISRKILVQMVLSDQSVR